MKYKVLKVLGLLMAAAVLTAGFLFLALSPAFSAVLPDNSASSFSNQSFIEDQNLTRLVEGLIDEYGLDRNNLCLVIKNLQDQREYRLNETQAFFAASVYKLPLAMLYYEDYLNQISDEGMENSRYGSLDYETICQDIEAAVVDSNNEAAKELFHNLGGWSQYASLRERYRKEPASLNLLEQERQANYIDGAYLKDVLENLYINRENFSELLFYLSRAQPESYLNGLIPELYLQKYGAYEQSLNIVGLNLANVPYLVVILSDQQQNIAGFMARLGKELNSYFNQEYKLSDTQSQYETSTLPNEEISESDPYQYFQEDRVTIAGSEGIPEEPCIRDQSESANSPDLNSIVK